MAGLIYTNQKSKLSKKQKAQREALLKQQKAIRKQLENSRRVAKPAFIDPVPQHRSSRDIPSLDTGGGSTSKRVSPAYTGSAIIGLSVMHKSNIVPVFSREDAEAIARMRR